MHVIHPESHVDHVPACVIQAVILAFADLANPDKRIIIETFELPEEAGAVACALYGPVMGDPPVSEDEVEYRVRPGRTWPSRTIACPVRPTRTLIVVAGPHDSHDSGAVHLLWRPGGPSGSQRPQPQARRFGGVDRVLERPRPGPGDMIAMKTAAERCHCLLSCAEQHGEAEGSEVQLGDIEDFFRTAFDLLTPEQFGRFWDNPRVVGNVREIPEYEELAGEVYAHCDSVNDAEAQPPWPGPVTVDHERRTLTWEQLAERIASMTLGERRTPVQPMADRLALVALFLKIGEEAPDGFTTATGLRFDLAEVEDVGDGDRRAWYSWRR